MHKTRRLYRRETQKERLFSALRALYADGVRVCTGRRRAPVEPPAAAPRTPPRPPPTPRLSLLDERDAYGTDPYNTSRR